MKYSKEKPTVPGWYWINGSHEFISFLSEDMIFNIHHHGIFDGYEFAGPLPKPGKSYETKS